MGVVEHSENGVNTNSTWYLDFGLTIMKSILELKTLLCTCSLAYTKLSHASAMQQKHDIGWERVR